MTPEAVGILSAVVSVFGAVVAAGVTSWSARRTRGYELAIEEQRRRQSREEQAAAILSRYREPLLWAAQNLQSRLFNALCGDYFQKYLHCGDPAEERYARDYTVYVLAEYLCWREILSRELRFLDLDSQREILVHLDGIGRAMSGMAEPAVFRLFRGQQRAIGELMMVPTGEAEGPRHECLRYSAFCAKLDDDPIFAGWFARLRADVGELLSTDPAVRGRLMRIQWGLIDLIDFLDPTRHRLPTDHREKAHEQPPAAGHEPLPAAGPEPARSTGSGR